MNKPLNISKGIFIITLPASIYCILASSIKVYSTSFIGALFELLWLPSLLVIFVVPFISLFFWFKEKFILKSINLLSFVIAAATAIFILIKK